MLFFRSDIFNGNKLMGYQVVGDIVLTKIWFRTMLPMMRRRITSSREFKDIYTACVMMTGTVLMGMDLSFSSFFLEGEKGVTRTEESVVGSINLFFRIPGSIFAILITDHIGRKHTIELSLVMYIIAWTLLMAPTPFLEIGRALSGFTGSLQMAAVLYTSEVCHPKRRGALVSMRLLATSLGIAICTTTAYFFNIKVVEIVAVCIAGCGLVAVYPIPESKYFYLYRNERKNAAASISWFSEDSSPEEIEWEIQSIEISLREKKSSSTNFKCLRALRSELKPFLMCLCLIVCLSGTGRVALLAHMKHVFQVFQTDFDSEKLVAVMTIMEFFFATIYVFIVDKFKRKTVFYFTTCTALFCLTGILAYRYEQNVLGIHWPLFPIILLSAYMILCVTGIMSSVLVAESESLNKEHRGALMNVLSCAHMLYSAVFSSALPYILDTVPMHYVLTFFCMVVILMIVIVKLFLPENSGKELYECAELRSEQKKQSELRKSLSSQGDL